MNTIACNVLACGATTVQALVRLLLQIARRAHCLHYLLAAAARALIEDYNIVSASAQSFPCYGDIITLC